MCAISVSVRRMIEGVPGFLSCLVVPQAPLQAEVALPGDSTRSLPELGMVLVVMGAGAGGAEGSAKRKGLKGLGARQR